MVGNLGSFTPRKSPGTHWRRLGRTQGRSGQDMAKKESLSPHLGSNPIPSSPEQVAVIVRENSQMAHHTMLWRPSVNIATNLRIE
jgi:hypothetical protein